MPRSRMFDTFREAPAFGPFDEYPVLSPGVDPQLHLSRNDRPQPFYLICGKDSVLVQMSGGATVHFKLSDVLRYRLRTGDFVYIPAGTPHCIVPEGIALNYRYKAERAGLEGVAWYCPRCDAEIHRDVWDTEVELPQEGYARASAAFNRDPALRACPACGVEHPPLDLHGFRWTDIARELRVPRER